MIAVVYVEEADRKTATAFLPPTNWRAEGNGRVYWAFDVDHAEDLAFTDGISGEPLIALRAFDTLDEARGWVLDDMRQRDHLQVRGRVQ